jgi:hypothetical protein
MLHAIVLIKLYTLYQEVSKTRSNDCETCGDTFESRYTWSSVFSTLSPLLCRYHTVTLPIYG